MTTKITINKTDKIFSVSNLAQNSSVKLVGNKNRTPSVILSFLSSLRTVESDEAGITGYEEIKAGKQNKQGNIVFEFDGGRKVILGNNLWGFAQSVDGTLIEDKSDWTNYISNNPPAPGPTPGQAFTLTTNADTATANVFNGNVKIEGLFALNTLNNGDRLTGSGVNPTLNVTLNTANGAAGAITPALLSNIQTANFEFAAFGGAAGAANLGFQNATGLTNVSWANAGAASALTGLGAALTDLSVTNTQFQQTFLFTDAALAGTADTLNLSVNANVSGASGVLINTVNGTSFYETVNIASQGSVTNNFDVSQNAGAASYTTLNVSGSAPFTTINRSAALAVFDASTATGNISYTANGEGIAAYTGGTGNDNFILDGTFSNQDTVNGGTGTDTITTTSAIATGYAAVTPVTVSNVEVLALSTELGAALTTANISAGINTLELQAVTNAASRQVNTPAGTFTVRNDANSGLANAARTLTFDAAGTATTDVLNVLNVSTAAVDNFAANAQLTATDYETVNFSTGTTTVNGAQSINALTITPTAGGTSTLTLTGVNGLTTGAITSNVINASGLTGAAALTMGAPAVNLTSITGSANADTLVGDASSSISGGAGADTITGGAGNDTLLGGDGNDQITSNAGNDSIDGGAGNDSILLAANLTQADTVSGGEGTEDVILLTTADFTAAQASNVSNFEVLVLTNAGLGGATTVTMTNFIANPGFTNVVLNDQNTQAVTIANASASLNTVGLGAGLGGDSVVFQRLIDTSTNALTLRTEGAPGAAITAVTANDEETITATTLFNGANEATTITTLTGGDLRTLNIQGGAAYTITALTAAGISTIDATGNTAAVTINTQASAVNPLTVTAGTGGLTFSAGTAADTITGGIGADNIWGWTGADTINVGSGTDTLRYSADQAAAGNLDTALYVAPVANSISTVGMDVVSGLAAGDIINFNATNLADGANSGYSGNAGAALGLVANGTAANTLAATAGVDNAIVIVRGTYTAASNTFVGSGSGADSLIIYDSNATLTASSFNSFVAAGYVAASVTGIGGNAGVVTLA